METDQSSSRLIEALKRLDAKETTKKEICREMNITPPVLDKYIFIINIGRSQHETG